MSVRACLLLSRFVVGWTLYFAIGSPAIAQYTAPGELSSEEEIPSKESFESSIRVSPWRLAGVHLLPWAAIKDASTVQIELGTENDNSEDDFTITFGAGLHAYARPTSKLIVTAHALPEYVYWDSNDEKDRLNGQYGFGMFGYFNRLRFQVSEQQIERQQYFSSEVQELTSVGTRTTTIQTEIELARRFEVVTGAITEEFVAQEDDSPVFSSLDRDQERIFAGLRYTTPRGLSFLATHYDVTVGFRPDGRNLSSQGTTTLIGLASDKEDRLTYGVSWYLNDFEPQAGSDFVAFSDSTYEAYIGWDTPSRLGIVGYQRESLGFSVDPRYSHFVNERHGATLKLSLDVGSFSLTGEFGEDQFESLTPATQPRTDRVETILATLDFKLKRALNFQLAASNSEYNSSDDDFDRTVSDFSFSIVLSALEQILGIGGREREW